MLQGPLQYLFGKMCGALRVFHFPRKGFSVNSSGDLFAILLTVACILPGLKTDLWQIASGVLVIAFPQSFFFTFPWMVVSIWQKMPDVGAHRLAILLFGSFLIMYFAFRWLRFSENRKDWFQEVAPTLAVMVLILYFFTAFFKINSEFLDPNYSCVTSMISKIFSVWKIQGPDFPDWTLRLSIWSSIIIEFLLIPLIYFRRTRPLGLFLGTVFHLILGLAGYFRFSLIINALYLAFIPEELVKKTLASKFVKNILYVTTALIIGIGIFRPVITNHLILDKEIWNWYMFLVYVIVSIPVWKAIWRYGRQYEGRNETSIRSRLPWAYHFFPFLVVFVGMMPFLGLKTQGGISMFSNLRTEGGASNHLIVPDGAFEFFHFQRDLVDVEIVEFKQKPNIGKTTRRLYSLPGWVKMRNFKIPLFELQRFRNVIVDANLGEFVIKYSYQGQKHSSNFVDDPLLTGSWPRLLGKFLMFRPVIAPRQNFCPW